MTDVVKQETGFLTALWRGVAGFFRQLWYGRDDKRKEQMIAEVAKTAEGRRLLKLASDNDIPIRIAPKGFMADTFGIVEKDDGDATVSIKVGNNGHPVDMATTLHHELRHIEQQRARGTLAKGFFGGLEDATRQHMVSLLEEADAFTAEAVEAWKRDRAGDPAWMDEMYARGGAATSTALVFMEEHPPEKFASEAAFSRALLAHMMMHALDGYSKDYFGEYGQAFRENSSVAEFRKALAEEPQIPADPAAPELMKLYGGGMSLASAFADVFVKALPAKVRDTLKMIEDAVAEADRMTEDDYAAVRRTVMSRTERLSEEFNERSADTRISARREKAVYRELKTKLPAVTAAA